MRSDPYIWHKWAQLLHRWGVANWVAALIEAAGPLTLLGAQLIYIGRPLLDITFSEDQLNALANMLENGEQTKAFTSYLRETALE